MVDEFRATMVLSEGEQVSVVAGNKTYRGTLTHDAGRWFIKLAAVEDGASDEVVIAKL